MGIYFPLTSIEMLLREIYREVTIAFELTFLVRVGLGS